MINIVLCVLVGLDAFLYACVKDELVRIRKMLEEERYE